MSDSAHSGSKREPKVSFSFASDDGSDQVGEHMSENDNVEVSIQKEGKPKLTRKLKTGRKSEMGKSKASRKEAPKPKKASKAKSKGSRKEALKSKKTSKAKSKGGASKAPVIKKKRKKARDYGSYAIYIRRVAKSTHPDLSMSAKALSVMDSIVQDIYMKLCADAALLTSYAKKKTMSGRDMKAAISLVFPPELAFHAISAGDKAMAMYKASMDRQGRQ